MVGMRDILLALAQLTNRSAHTVQLGKIKEWREGMARVELGAGQDGKPWLTPWLHCGEHMGEARERVPFKVGQNVLVYSPGGEVGTHSIVRPYAPSDSNKLDKADAPNDAHTYWFKDKVRRQTKDGDVKTEVGTKDDAGRSVKRQTAEEVLERVGVEAKKILNRTSWLTQIGTVEATASKFFQEAQKLASSIGPNVLHEITPANILNRMGLDASTILTPASLVQKVGDAIKTFTPASIVQAVGGVSTITQSAAGILKQVTGGASQFLSANGIISAVQGVTHNLTALGNQFLGGLVNHDGIDIGKTHMHVAMTRFGPAPVLSVAASIAAGFAGSSTGSNDGSGTGGTPPGDLTGDTTPLGADNVPWAWGRVRVNHPVAGTCQLGRSGGTLTVERLAQGSYLVHLDLTASPNGDDACPVLVSADLASLGVMTNESTLWVRTHNGEDAGGFSYLVLP